MALSKKYKILMFGVVACVLMAALGLYMQHLNTMVTDGEMPSEPVAISIRDDALAFLSLCLESGEVEAELPHSIAQLNPLHYRIEDNGVLFIFMTQFVEVYGYYFSTDNTEMSGYESRLCTEINPGLYRYYNPG